MNKRDVVLEVLDPNSPQRYTPAGFFIHFDPVYHRGRAAVDKHLEYFRYTGMDFVKIQFEDSFPRLPQIQRPEDWATMPHYGRDFYQNQLDILAGLLQEAQQEALVIMTIYSPFMCAGHTATSELVNEHIKSDPYHFKKGMEIITDSLLGFVRGCIELGIDGFYASTQGGEADRFGGSPLFDECIKPYDLVLMEEMNRNCIFNILHVCDYHSSYDDLTPFLDYPGHVVNASLELGGRPIAARQVSQMFGRPFMGGLERKGLIAQQGPAEIRQAVQAVLRNAPAKFILGADCTLPGDINWNNIRAAINAAHEHPAAS